MNYLICLIFVFAASYIYSGEIITTNDFGRIIEEVDRLDKDSLLLFDVDGTLIIPIDAILLPKNKKLFNELVSGYSDRDLFREIRMKAPHVLVDKRSASFVQKIKVPILALTAAPAKIKQDQTGMWRVNELKFYGFDFMYTYPRYETLDFPEYTDPLPMFKKGVLYSSFHSKGEVLVSFLKKLQLKPSRIIFVDDELVHVQAVVTSLDKYGISNLGIHYTAANEIDCVLDSEVAKFQIENFVKHNLWLSDKDVN